MALVLLLGAVLRIWQWAAGSALWVDEVAIARNVLERSLWQLVSLPLAFEQQTPLGFLAVEKGVTWLFGASDRALRLVPVLGGVGALFAFERLARRMLTGAGPLIAVTLFAFGAPLILNCAQVKQYSTDAAMTVLLLWLGEALHRRSASGMRAVWSAAAGAAAVWFSQSATVVLTGVGLALLLRRRSPVPLLPILATWALSAAAVSALALRQLAPGTEAFLHAFWASGLPPLGAGSPLEWGWALEAMRDQLGARGLGYPLPGAYLALAALGLGWLGWRERGHALLLAVPCAVALGLAWARLVPFTGRLIVYLLPIVFLALAAALEAVRQSVPPPLGTLAVLPVVTGALAPLVFTPPPFRIEDIRPALEHLEAERRPGDRLYVYYGARPAAAFYGTRADLLGGCHRGEPRRYLEELDALRGSSRAWILITHAVFASGEQPLLTGYLDAIGTRRDDYALPSRTVGIPRPGVELLLYDLADPNRLARSSADAYPVPETVSLASMPCDHGTWLMLSPPQSSSNPGLQP